MKLSLSILLSVLILNLAAQTSGTIAGRITDSEGISLPYSTITLLEKNSGELFSGAISDSTGRFVLKGIPGGEYLIQFSFVGYESLQKEILIGELNTNFDVGRIQLNETTQNIDEVTVKARRDAVSYGMEKHTYNLDENIAQSGGSILDAMKTMPGVTVDQDGKVILRGSDKVVVLIDGKQSGLTGFGNQKGLDNIPSSNIEIIEIINNPSAKYDAAGMAGIINIVYKKEKSTGLSGDISLSYGLGALTKSNIDLPTELGSYSKNSKLIPSLNLNYRTSKINVFLQSEMFRQNALPNNEFATRYYDDGRITASQVPENRIQSHFINRAGVDIYLNDNNQLTLSGVYDWERHIDTAQVPYIDMTVFERYRYITWMEEEITGYMNYSIDYKHKFSGEGHEINANLQYTRGWEDETYNLHDSSAIRIADDKTNILAIEHTTNFNVDYVKPLLSGRMESGLKLQIRRLPVDFTLTPGVNSMIYPGLGSWSDWGENIFGGYINYVLEKPLFDIEAGLRAEQTDVFYEIDPANIYYSENDSYSYFDFFPSIRLTYKIDRNMRLSAFYNRRIDRPGEPELRIFTKSDDHELVKSGNPYLRPQYTQSAELAYKLRWNTGSFTLSTYYKLTDNPFMRVFSIDENNLIYDVVTRVYANTGSSNSLGLEFIAGQQIGDFWKISASLNLYKNRIDSYTGTLLFPYEHTFSILETVDNTWNTKLSNQFDLPGDFQIQLTGVYYAEMNIPQGKQFARSSIDAGLKKKILSGKGELNFSASDIFNNFGIRQDILGDGFEARYENLYETQIFRLGFKYKF